MYDIIGDIHGCYDELLLLLERLGYRQEKGIYTHPEGRKFVSVGDLMDRGPKSLPTIQFMTKHVRQQKALYVPGNHCDKLYRLFLGRNVQIRHGLETTVAELGQVDAHTKAQIKTEFIQLVEEAPLYFVLDAGRLIVSHAGIRQNDIGKNNKQVKKFCLYGDITGEKDEQGFPVRKDWAQDYHGKSWIIYGHTPVKQPRWVNHTINIDTGCVFGGHLTALRYPEFTFEQIPSSLPLVAEKFRLI